MDRLMMPLVNEAAMCLLENVARAGDIDMGMIAGTGMKVGQDRIGPLEYADSVRLDVVLEKLLELQRAYGERFARLACSRPRSARAIWGRRWARGSRSTAGWTRFQPNYGPGG